MAIALGVGLLTAPLADAQGRRGAIQRGQHLPRIKNAPKGPKTPIQEFETMSPDEQRRALNRLPPNQRRNLEERLNRFNQLPEQQRQALTNLYNRLHQLPSERQNSVRKAINKFSEQPADRQELIRQELRRMAALPAGERTQHLGSADVRSSLSKKEQDILRDMIPLLPE